MKFSHFNVITESKFIDSVYTDLFQLVACYDNGQEAPFNADYMVIKTFFNLDEGIEVLKTMNQSIDVWNII